MGPTLDATLAFVPSAPADLALWDSGDVGGFECHVEASAEDSRTSVTMEALEEGDEEEETGSIDRRHAARRP